MDKLIIALGPAFAAGFAVQRFLAILDPTLEKSKFFKDHKRVILAWVSLTVGLILAFWAGLRVLKPLGYQSTDFIDGIVTALIVSAGTDGFNSITKFLGYAKANKKSEAAFNLDRLGTSGKECIKKIENIA